MAGKRERFLKVAKVRTQRALRALDQVAKCGNRASHDYTPEEAAQIVAALEARVAKVRAAFEPEQEFDFGTQD